ncbi:MAG TPA: pitrilysin family protein [Xanthobacteraceae bacterium]|nr:pitrilysin family protein [Xanthobacteraceae bacterium]
MMSTLAAVAVAGSAALATPRIAEAIAGPDISHFKLENGMEVVVIPDRRTPVVTHMVWYRVGSADEEAGKTGIAHFLEHLMFKGTKKNPSGRFSKVLAEIGGQENAFTSQDYTAYFQRVAKEHLPMLMEFEADRMTGLVLTDANVLPERDVVLEERRSRTDSDPSAILSEAAQAALFANHPYGKPVIGWEHEIRALNRQDALDFYRVHYAPNNAILIVAGDVSADEVRTLAEKTYGAIPAGTSIKPRVRPEEPEPRAQRRVELTDPRVRQPQLSRYYLAPSYANAAVGEAEALDVLAHILGSGSLSRLYRALVVEQQVAVNAGAWYQGTALDKGRFGVYATPRPGTSLDALETAIDGVLAKVVAEGVESAELERAKTRLIADSVYAQDNQSRLARMYGAGMTTGSTVEQIRTWPDRIREVRPETVREAARKWLELRRSVTSRLLPAAPKTEKPS